jgi:23S rRNA (uracil1939-C5)-methyltransferase
VSPPPTPSPAAGQAGQSRRVRIEKLAPTGEGIARTAEGVGFVDRALPGELVETSIYEARKRFWRGSLRAVLEPSPERVDTPHASCAGCDWAHFEPAAARRAKRELFLETMERIGKLDSGLFGEALLAASAPGYRLRVRLHATGRDESVRVGYFAPGSHRVVPADACEALSAATRALLPRIEAAIAGSGTQVSEIGMLEDIGGSRRLIRLSVPTDAEKVADLAHRLDDLFDGVRIQSSEGPMLLERGVRSIDLEVGARSFAVSVDSFFQGNRELVGRLAADVEAWVRRVAPGEALDAFGGAGLFAGALLSTGHAVTTVELDGAAVADARATRARWPDRARWAIAASEVGRFLAADGRRFDVVVADPPRSGLGVELAAELGRRARRLFLYVSCDPATLARDLPAIRGQGLEICGAMLYDLFAFTHRIEALVALERGV